MLRVYIVWILNKMLCVTFMFRRLAESCLGLIQYDMDLEYFKKFFERTQIPRNAMYRITK